MVNFGCGIDFLSEDRAYLFSESWHAGQKYGEEDYFTKHILKVVEYVQTSGGSPEAIVVAYLHDVVEDTGATIEDVKRFFGEEIAEVVDVLTKREEDGRDDYLKRVLKNPTARFVKMQDAICNLQESYKSGDARRIRRYELTISTLIRGVV
jgi:(p)ppGpp synthase/HD superfamily hydrolase